MIGDAMMTTRRLLLAILLVCVSATFSLAQGVQNGIIRGAVHDEQGLPVPGVTVTATSPALQGPRSTLTAADGGFVLPALPAGDYSVAFELSNFATITKTARVPVGSTVDENVTMKAAGVSESVQVVAETPAVIATPVVGADFKHEEIESLATPRTLEGIAQLSPALTENSPNTGQVVINGGFAFDNVFMINGVDVNDNLFANPQNLFIEDAIEETQILTSGISAEYGRFGGGVVNAITKSGGDTFSGSFRTNFQNPAWTDETPFEKSNGTERPSTLQEGYEATLGGPVFKKRLWFFSAGRYAAVDNTLNLTQTGIQEIQNDNNKRGEVKLTGTVAQNHTIQGGYLNNARTVSNTSGIESFVIDPHSLITRSLPNWYYYTNYHGVVSDRLLVEAQYSERRFKFQGDGGTSTNILDSPILSATQCACLYNAPYFDATDPEQRNNRQLTASVTDYWQLGGRHETKGGYEFFRSQRTGGNSQSSTSYVFNADFATDPAGNPLLDSTGRPIPTFVPGTSFLDFFPAVRGAVLNVNQNSAYVQDHWIVNSHVSADIGARYEHVKAISTGDLISVDNNRIVPRLAVAYDLRGDGKHVVHTTYGQYSGRYNEAQIGANSPVGNPPDIEPKYQGPAGQGYSFAPGFDITNYPVTAANASVSDPTKNISTSPDLKSPLVHEFSASYGANIGNGRGYAEATYVYRKTTDLIEDFQTIANGFTDVVVNGIDAGLFTNKLFQNTDLAHREYQGLVFQSRYRITPRWSINGHYTLQLKNNGNYEGEGSNTPGSTSFIGNYPEAFDPARNFPDGHLQDFQRHRLRLWSIYDFGMGRFGDLSVSGLWRLDSGLAYSLVARNQPLTDEQNALIAAAGYPDFPPPAGNEVFFGNRGAQTFPGYGLVDMSINYNVPILRSLRPWVKFDVYNLFDNEKLIAWNTTVSQDPNSPKDQLGLATGFLPGSAFGTASGNTVTNLFNNGINAFPVPFNGTTGGRTFRVGVGFRF
jgi:hypothetical protein